MIKIIGRWQESLNHHRTTMLTREPEPATNLFDKVT